MNYYTFTFRITHLGRFGAEKHFTFKDDFNGEIIHLEIDAEPALKLTIFKKIDKERKIGESNAI